MQKLEHEEAIYWDHAGVRHEIQAEELSDPKILEKAKSVDLCDDTGQMRLSPRLIPGRRPHFYAPPTDVNRSVFRFEKNPIHDQRVECLLNTLTLENVTQWKILESHYENGQPITTDLFQISGYSWGKETHRIVSANSIVRHDLFGQSRAIEMSVFRPWVAIEVINTHFPEAGAFQTFMALSSMVPLIVMFDCTDAENHFLKIDKQAGTVNTKLHIRDGAVWFNGRLTDIGSSIALEIFIKKEIAAWQKKNAWKLQKAAEAKAGR